MPYIKNISEFYDQNVSEYFKNTIELRDQYWLNNFANCLTVGVKVGDMGCGFGRDCKFFVEKNFKVYGADISKNMIKEAKKYEPKAKYGIMNILELKYSDQYFDGVWCSAVLYHLKKSDIQKALSELRRILKDNGIIFLSFKEGKGQRVIKDERYNKAKRLITYYTEGQVKKMLSQNNFKLIDFEIEVESKIKYKNNGIIFLLARKLKE
ncbi:MAG: class I SAM-dependent methyltransferase [bacterium]